MKKFLIVALIVSGVYAKQNQMPPKMQEGLKAIKMLGGTLKSHLKKALKQDKSGVKAIKFCSSKAMELTHEVNKKLPQNIKVRRVALKYRNQANKPDSIDEKVLKEFEASLTKKEKLKPKMVEVNNTTRVYKPLLVKKVCLKCHGANIEENIAKVIKKHYPNDKATGFKEGDLRGAIVAEIKK